MENGINKGKNIMNIPDKTLCKGCQHKIFVKGQWCYMFLKAPNTLPCGQHDMYKEQRRINGRKLFYHMKIADAITKM